ncbi:glycosyltransferase family 2 protein [Rhizobium sp. SA279]
MRLAIIIPCYNERDNIPLIISHLRETIGERSDVDVILVDNGSTDGSDAVLANTLKAGSPIRSVKVPKNQGYGYGILFGLASTDADVLAWTHADMQTDPNDVLVGFDRLRQYGNPKVIVKGRRKNRRFLEAFFTFGMQVLAAFALRVRLSDVNAQPKIFPRSFYENFIREKAPHDFSLDLFLLYQAQVNEYSVVEIPVIFAERVHGVAKGGGSWKTRIKLIRRTVAYIFDLRRSLILKRDNQV